MGGPHAFDRISCIDRCLHPCSASFDRCPHLRVAPHASIAYHTSIVNHTSITYHTSIVYHILIYALTHAALHSIACSAMQCFVRSLSAPTCGISIVHHTTIAYHTSIACRSYKYIDCILHIIPRSYIIHRLHHRYRSHHMH